MGKFLIGAKEESWVKLFKEKWKIEGESENWRWNVSGWEDFKQNEGERGAALGLAAEWGRKKQIGNWVNFVLWKKG